ncbi:MAG: phenylalanine--tRNA ligase subunit beta [Patescibacteria group bacterium]|nr:phenylalanine--tRNA ligase subunit beta [Patescibacteria group bacterium]
MKFSFPLIKRFLPLVKNKAQIIEALTMYAFEAEDSIGNSFEVNLPPNRYADVSSHWGIAKELAAIFDWFVDYGGMKKLPVVDFIKNKLSVNKKKNLDIEVWDHKLCPRYTACYLEGILIKDSPKWLQDVLIDCGLRPINNVVDIMNYVMLEMGQPLHAFDVDKLEGGKIIIRWAKRGEKMITIDGVKYDLTPEILVIADAKKPVAIAGIKGGRGPEVSETTKRIIIEAANFDSVSIYKTSKILGLVTDASVRFSHLLSGELAILGLGRSAYVLKDLFGAQIIDYFDSRKKPLPKHILKFDINKFNKFIGTKLKCEEVGAYLRRLGFRNVLKDEWEVPILRTDIENHEDVIEEAARLQGFNNLKPQAPKVNLVPATEDDVIILKEKARCALASFGVDEVYNHSFVAKKDLNLVGVKLDGAVELENPISQEFQYLRPSLKPGLIANFEHNSKFFNDFKIFEIGKIFNRNGKRIKEYNSFGILFASKNKETFFPLKGVMNSFLKSLGVIDFIFAPENSSKLAPFQENSALKLEVDGNVIGYLGKFADVFKDWQVSISELDFDKLLESIESEEEFQPLSKYPAVIRDISIFVGKAVQIGDLMQEIELSNKELINDVDLVDEYFDSKRSNKQSLTFRIVFQAKNKTLTSEEVDREMDKIISLLKRKFGVEIR